MYNCGVTQCSISDVNIFTIIRLEVSYKKILNCTTLSKQHEMCPVVFTLIKVAGTSFFFYIGLIIKRRLQTKEIT